MKSLNLMTLRAALLTPRNDALLVMSYWFK